MKDICSSEIKVLALYNLCYYCRFVFPVPVLSSSQKEWSKFFYEKTFLRKYSFKFGSRKNSVPQGKRLRLKLPKDLHES